MVRSSQESRHFSDERFKTYGMNRHLLGKYRDNVDTDISLRWYIDQVKQYYEKEVKGNITDSSEDNVGYVNKEMVDILDNTKFNGRCASDMVGGFLWKDIISSKLVFANNRDKDYMLFNADDIIMEYLDDLEYCFNFLISYDDIMSGASDFGKCMRSSAQNMLYSNKAYDIVIHCNDRRDINIKQVSGLDIPTRYYIRNLEIYNKQGVSRVGNCSIEKIKCNEGKVNIICYTYDRRYILGI